MTNLARRGPPPSALIVPGENDEHKPVLMYLATLSTDKSRKTAIESMKRVAKAGKYANWQSIPWRSMSAERTTYIRARLLERAPRGLGVDPRTVKLTLSQLRSVLRQARKLGFFSAEALADMTDWPKIRAVTLPRGRALEPAEIDQLRAFCATQKPLFGALLKALLAVLLGAGLRREEVATLDLQALERGRLRVLGKGRKERLMPLPSWAAADLRAWLELRRGLRVQQATMFVRVDSDDRVYDQALSPWSVWNRVVTLTEDAGIEDVSTHDLRRTYASRLMEATDIKTVADLMGHAQTTTTAGYDRRGEKAAAKAVEALEEWGER